MKKLLPLVFVVAACAGSDYNAEGQLLKATVQYDRAHEAAVEYAALPACGTTEGDCSDPALVSQIDAKDAFAESKLDDADVADDESVIDARAAVTSYIDFLEANGIDVFLGEKL